MSTSIEQLQVFYEIAMSIGSHLNLKKMTKTALSAYVKKLNCSGGCVLQYSTTPDGLVIFDTIYAIPRSFWNFENYQKVIKKFLLNSNMGKPENLLPVQYVSESGRNIAIMSLPGFGILVLAREGCGFDNNLLLSIRQININFSSSCQRCVQNEIVQKSEEKFRNIFESIQDVYVEIDANSGTILEVSPSIEKMVGYRRDEMLGHDMIEFYENREQRLELMTLIFKNGAAQDYESSLITKSGSKIIVSFSVYLISSKDNSPYKVVGTMRDITERKKAEEVLADERLRLKSILEGTCAGTWEWNVQTGDVVFNERWAEIVGYSLSDLSPISIETWANLVHPDDLVKSNELLEKCFNKELEYYEFEARMLHKSGEWVWILDRGKVFAWTDDGRPLLMFGTHQDITERKNFEEQIKHLASHDSLTGIPNTRVAIDRIQIAIKQANRNDTMVAVLFLDLDGFKIINDSFGHEAGDCVLKEVANRLVSCLREVDTVARIGGDEFLIVLSGIKVSDCAAKVADKVIKEVSRPISFKGEDLNVGTSIGVALYPTNGDEADFLVKVADHAMYAAKKSGKNRYFFANNEI